MIEEALRRQLEPVVDRRQRLSLAWRLSIYWLACGLAALVLIGADRLFGFRSPHAIGSLVRRRRRGHVWDDLPVPPPAAGLPGHCPNYRATDIRI